ncbi:MAG: GNAT family N-acetyltransferase [Myxococcota bacterium]
MPHAALHGYRGVWFFVRSGSAVVSAPPDWVDPLEQKLASAVAQELLSPDSAVRVVGRAAGAVVGPSFQGWLSADRFRPVPSHGVERLSESDVESVRAFQASCPHEDWDHGGINLAAAPVWASFRESGIVALGQLREHSDGAVDPGVVTHPDHRGQGHALRLVGTMAQAALSQERLVLYQTLLANVAALSVARRLGFARYATLVAVRLTRDAA